MAGRIWTTEEITMLRTLYPTMLTTKLAANMQRSVKSLYSMAGILGVNKTATYLKEHGSQLDGIIGKETRFKKGHATYNKGKKMPKELYKKCAHTMFKKGQLPHNTLRDGVIRTRTDKNGTKRPFIRVALSKWVEMKNHVWEQENGPLPKGRRRCQCQCSWGWLLIRLRCYRAEG